MMKGGDINDVEPVNREIAEIEAEFATTDKPRQLFEFEKEKNK